MSTFLLTHATQYTGPGVLDVLLGQGHSVVCHDVSFTDAAVRRAFAEKSPAIRALQAQTPEDIFAEVSAIGDMDGFIFNDAYPRVSQEIEHIDIDLLRNTFEALLVFPLRLSQLFVPGLKARRKGAVVFVTSARSLRPESGFAVATTIRAGTTAFALALAKDMAPYEVPVNVVAPNYLGNEMYYPKARFVDDPAGRAAIAKIVPFGRLGEQEEIGELVAFFASGKSRFTTGQVIYFTGGWP